MKDIIIGIDPDIDRNGVAVLRTAERSMRVDKLRFPDMLDFVAREAREAEAEGKSVSVWVEAGWLNASNWHARPGMSANYNASIGQAVGRNQAVGMLALQMLTHMSVPASPIRPLPKVMRVGSSTVPMWSGRDGKVTANELAQLLARHNITVSPPRMNQDQRDAVLIALRGADIPVVPHF